MKGQKGITLIALIITIIVMLILVGVTLVIAFDPNNGLVKKATTAKEDTGASQNRESDLFNGEELVNGINNVVNGGSMNVSTAVPENAAQ